LAAFKSFSNIWLSELVIIKLVLSAYRTALDIHHTSLCSAWVLNPQPPSLY